MRVPPPRQSKGLLLILNLTLLATALAPKGLAQGGVPLWTNRYNGPGNDRDYANTMAVDDNGNVFVAGASPGSGSGLDFATIAYSSAGVALWTNRYNGPGPATSDDVVNGMAVDRSGNVIVTGQSGGDYATIKYSGAGVPLWTNRYNGPGNNTDYPYAVAVDTHGSVFVTGFSFGSGSGFSGFDYATVAYSGAGVPLWTNRYNGPANAGDRGTALAVDGNGNVFVTGISVGSDSDEDYATIKYSGAGMPLWTNRYNGPGNLYDWPYALAVDGGGNVVVTGGSVGNGSGYDFATIKYSGAGEPLWTNRYNGPGNSDDEALAVAVDRSGNVFITGVSYGTGHTNGDYVTIAYSTAGEPLWTNRYDGNGPGNSDDMPSSIAVDSRGNVFVTGTTGFSFLQSGDCTTIAYSGAGEPLRTNRYPGGGYALAADSNGNVFVTGESPGNSSASDFATIKYASSLLPYLDILNINGEVVLKWTNAAFGLQSASAVTGFFTNIPGATSPYTNSTTRPRQFFRLNGN